MREAFLQALDAPQRGRFEALPDLEFRLATIVAQAKARVKLGDGTAFVAYLAERLPANADAELLSAIHAADLALAWACGCGDGTALALFEAEFGRDLDQAITRAGPAGERPEDFRQRVHEKLFVAAEGEAPRITAYAGRGTLRSWVRVTAMRTMLDLVRWKPDSHNRPAQDADLFDRLPDGADPEVDYLRRALGEDLRGLLSQALARMTPRQRNLLRQRYLHDVAPDRIAAIYGVHRATTFRWLEDARGALLIHLRRVAAQQLRLQPSELDSVMAALGSRLELSIRRLLDSKLERD